HGSPGTQRPVSVSHRRPVFSPHSRSRVHFGTQIFSFSSQRSQAWQSSWSSQGVTGVPPSPPAPPPPPPASPPVPPVFAGGFRLSSRSSPQPPPTKAASAATSRAIIGMV